MHLAGPRPFRFDLRELPKPLRVTVLAPHPDDFDAIGVTLRKLHQTGSTIHLAVLSACSGVEDSFCSPPTLEQKAAVREQEQRRSCLFFGLPGDHVEFPVLQLDDQGQPADEPGNAQLIQRILERTHAQWVFLPHGNDTNSGHQQTWAMFRRAAFALKRPLTACYNHDPKTVALRIDALTLFGSELAAWKGQLLRFHESQQHRNLLRRGYGLDERLLRANRQIADEQGFPDQFAEAFEIESFNITQDA